MIQMDTPNSNSGYFGRTALTQIRALRHDLANRDSVILAQNNGLVDAEKEMLGLLSSCGPEYMTEAFREAAIVYSDLANHYANVDDYESAEEMKIKEVVGLELFLDDIEDEKRKFDANIMIGNSYATLSNWQHKQLKKDDSLAKLLAFIKLDEAFNTALSNKNFKFNAQSFEFVENLISNSPLAMIGGYGEFSKEIYMMTLQAKDLCSIYGVLPYDASIIVCDELEKFNLSDISLVRKMIKEGAIEKPENIEINREMIAYHKRKKNYTQAQEKLKDNFSVVCENENMTFWKRNQL